MITVLIPLYNGIEFLKEAVDSVIAQTYTNWEIIIGVNGHPQGSPIFLSASLIASQSASLTATDKIRVIDLYDLPVAGKSEAMNEMVKYANYPYIAILDADDFWLPNKLEKQIQWVQKGYDVVGSQCVYFGERLVGMSPTIPLGDISNHDFFAANPVINSSAIVKKEYCWWDGSRHLTGIEDYDMWLRLRRQYKRFYNCPEVLIRHRIHSSSAFNSQGNGDRVPELVASYRRRPGYYRIRVFSSFGISENCKPVFERLCETDKMENYGPDKDIYFVDDDTYTHIILMNTPMPNLLVPKERVVGLAFEPPAFMMGDISRGFLEFAQHRVGKYLIGDATGLPAPFVTSYCYQWHITPPDREPVKDKLMSIMVSEKQQAPGHKYRHELVRAILSTNFNVDIYGKGCRFYSPADPRIKGEFTDDEPYEHYHYHICIENFQTPNYTSEKYTNAVLWGTTPIYWGAKNPIFPEYTIALSGDVIKDMIMIRDILTNPDTLKKKMDGAAVRRKLNILRNLDAVFS